MQLAPSAPTQFSQWPTLELRNLAEALQKNTQSCSSNHYYLYPCTKPKIELLLTKILADSQKDFAQNALELYRLIYLSSCAVGKERYQPICQTFSKTVLGDFLTPPDRPILTELTREILSEELSKISKAYTTLSGTILTDHGYNLQYSMSYRRTMFLNVEYRLTQGTFEEPVQPLFTLQLLALRLHTLMADFRARNSQGFRATSAFMAKSVGFGFLVPDPSPPHTLTFKSISSYVSIAMDSLSTGPRKRLQGLPSETVGAFRITFQPNTVDESTCYLRFYLNSPDLFALEDLWELREMLYQGYTSGKLTIDGLLSICKTLLGEIKLDEFHSQHFTNELTAPYLHTLIPLCLQQHLHSDPQIRNALVAKCQLKAANEPLSLILQDTPTLFEDVELIS